MLFDPELFDPPLFEDIVPVSVAPAPVFTVSRDDAGTPYSFTAPLKDPDSIERHGMDWSGWLQEGDSIAARSVFADTAGMTIDQISDAAGLVSWRVSGGAESENYIVTCRIETQSGLIDDRSIRYRIAHR